MPKTSWNLRRRFSQAFVALVLAVGLAAPGKAALIAGTDGVMFNWTTDTITRLDWMHFDGVGQKLRIPLGLTGEMSLTLVEGLLTEPEFAGWRLATTPEVIAFIHRVTGLDYVFVPISPVNQTGYSADFEGITDTMAALMGYSFDNEFGIDLQMVGGLTAETSCPHPGLAWPDPTCGPHAVVLSDSEAQPGRDKYRVDPGRWDSETTGLGMWLVRDSANVSEPSTLLLVMLAIATLATVTTRARSLTTVPVR